MGSGVPDYQFGTQKHNGFANPACFDRSAQAPTRPDLSELHSDKARFVSANYAGESELARRPKVSSLLSRAAPVTLLIRKTLSFFSRSTYKVTLDSQMHGTDAVSANGISIDGARFSIADLRSVVLPIGLVFTVIQNTSTDAIAGTFANLPDRSTITVGPNTFQVSYQGGDGNDLTLTVVP